MGDILIENLPFPSGVVFGGESIFLCTNRHLSELLQFGNEEIKGRSISLLCLYEDDSVRIRVLLDKARSNVHDYDEIYLKRKDGRSIKTVIAISLLAAGDNQNESTFLVQFHPIATRSQLPKELLSAIESIPLPICILEPDSYGIACKNSIFEECIGRILIESHTIYDISAKMQPNELDVDTALKYATDRLLHRPSLLCMWNFLNAEEEDVLHSVIASSLDLNETRYIVFVIEVAQQTIRDIMDEFTCWENLFVLSSQNASLILRESDHSIVQASEIALGLLKLSENKLVDKIFEDIFDPTDGHKHEEFFASFHPHCSAKCTLKLKGMPGKDKILIAEGCIRPHTDQSECMLVIALSLETELHLNARMEALVQQRVKEVVKGIDTKSQYLAMMTHEIRTPAQAIVMITGLLTESGLQEPWRQNIETLRISTELLLTILNDVLDFSKSNSGKLILEKRPFRLHSMLERTIDLLSPTVNRAQLDLLMDISPEVPKMIVGDSNRLMQIICNLVQNAVKFCNRGGTVIISAWVDEFTFGDNSQQLSDDSDHTSGDSVGEAEAIRLPKDSMGKAPMYPKSSSLVSDILSTKSCEVRKARIHFAVSDTGIGLDEITKARIFEPYAQANKSTSRRYGGSGLGLFICQKLCTQMKGKIWAESEGKNCGSSFHFKILFSEASSTPHSTPSVTPESPGYISPIVDATKSSEIIGLVSCSDQALAVYGHNISGWGWRLTNFPIGSARLLDVPHLSRVVMEYPNSSALLHRRSFSSIHSKDGESYKSMIAERKRRTSSLSSTSEIILPMKKEKDTCALNPTILVVDIPVGDSKESKMYRELTIQTVSDKVNDNVDLVVLCGPVEDQANCFASLSARSITVLKKPVSPLILRRCLYSVGKRTKHLAKKQSRESPHTEEQANLNLNAPTGSPVHISVDDVGQAPSLKVLVADDYFFSQAVMKTALKHLGCEFEVVDDGAEAVQAVSTQQFDVVFMDIHMPVMDGFEACKQIMALTLPFPRPFVCGLSASVSDEFKKKGIESGMNAYLSKPIKIDELRDFLKTVPKL